MRALKSLLLSAAAACILVAPAADAAARSKAQAPDLAAYVMAQHARAEQNISLESEFLDRAIDADPENTELLNQGLALAVRLGDFPLAVERAKKLEKAGLEDNALGLMIQVTDAFRRGKYKDAQTLLARTSGSTFDALIRPIGLAWALEAGGKTDEALAALDGLSTLSVFREYKDSHRAYILDHAGRVAEARVAYEALMAQPALRSLQPLGGYVDFLVRRGEGHIALALLDDYAARFPDHDYIGALKARVKAKRNIESPAADPSAGLAAATLQLGAELRRDGAIALALSYIRLTNFLTPDHGEAQLLAGDLLTELQDYQPARKAYDLAAKDPEQTRVARLRAANVIDQAGDTVAAIALLTDNLKASPTDVDMLTTLGDLERKRENYAAAVDWYSKALDALGTPKQKDWFLLFARGIAYERMKAWDKAEPDLLKALELQPDEPQVMNYLGYSWIDRGVNKTRAKTLIERAVAARPNDGFIVDSWGWVLYLDKDYAQAVEQLERAVLLEPGDPTLNEHLGDAYWRAGRQREARFQWDHALVFEPTPDQAKGLKTKLDNGLPPLEAGHVGKH